MTYEEFREQWKPEHKAWGAEADPADMVAPPQEKVGQGWVAERPPHTTFNWHQNRTDLRLEELEARVAWLGRMLEQSTAAAAGTR